MSNDTRQNPILIEPEGDWSANANLSKPTDGLVQTRTNADASPKRGGFWKTSSKPYAVEVQDKVVGIGMPCPACRCPRDSSSRFCVACGLPFEVPNESTAIASSKKVGESSILGQGSTRTSSISSATSSSATSPSNSGFVTQSTLFHCQNCGANVETSEDQRSYRCPFCDSTYVVEAEDVAGNRQRPEFILGFSITPEQARSKFLQWIGSNSLFRPGDLNLKAVTEKQKGVYIPFWHFSIKAESNWSAQIGEYWYRTETYTVTDKDGKTQTMTRVVRETEWWPLSGQHRKYYSGFMVSGSIGLPQNEALAIQPYNLAELVRFKPYFLAGWLSEEYSIEAQKAISVATDEFRKRESSTVYQTLPGDTSAGFSISSDFDHSGTDLILLPVHVLSYRYKEKVYRFLVNGQTGKLYGQKPWSAIRISMAVILGMIIIAIIVFILMSFNSSH